MDNTTVKKLPVGTVLKDAAGYFRRNLKGMLPFTLFNYLMLAAGVYFWKTPLLWLLLAVVYVFWAYFFRYYFKRKPYLEFHALFYSLVPSTKIVVLTVLTALLLAVLPFLPLFLGFSQDFKDEYMLFLQRYMQDSDWVDLGLSLVVVVTSPLILFRPYLAWISALIGRSGTLRSAWNRPRGNYWEFLLLAVVFELSFMCIQEMCRFWGWPLLVQMIVYAPMTVFLNVVLARAYEFFFIELEK